MALSDARRRANKKWDDKNKDKKKLYQYRSYARSYIKNMASDADLDELEELIIERRKND